MNILNCGKPVVLVLAAAFFLAVPAEAAWVKPNKKKVTALQGFQDSANGAVQSVLPWNWFGQRKHEEFERIGGYTIRRKPKKV